MAAEPGVPKPDPILFADGVRRQFGGIVAVDVDHLEVQRGSITALIGPNGAGKTTFFNVVTGFDEANSGRWTFNGHELDGVAAHKVAKLGMVRTFQLTKSLTKMSVIENMKLGATGQSGERMWKGLIPFLWRSQEDAIEERARRVARPVQARREGARLRRHTLRRSAQAARDGAGADGQSGAGDARRADGRRQPGAQAEPQPAHPWLRDEGMTVLFVEHDMDMVHDISDWVVVMAEGRVIAEGTPDDIASNPAVIDAYLGAHQGQSLLDDEWESET